MELKDLSPEARHTMYTLFEKRDEILKSEHLTDSAKAWMREVNWMQEHDALYYCE